MRRILVSLGLITAFAGCVQVIPEEPIAEPTFENYFGRISLQPYGYYLAIYGTLKSGDTVDIGYMAPIISEFFWTDSTNFERWRAGDTTATLRDRTLDQSVIDRYIVIPEDGTYYFVIVNWEDTTMSVAVRLMRRAGQ